MNNLQPPRPFLPANQPGMRANSPLLPLVILLLVLLQLIFPFQGWMMLLVGLGTAWLVSFLWAQSLAHRLELIREMRMGWVQVGDRLEERFTLSNTGWAPALWVEVEDYSTLPGHAASRVTGVDAYAENSWSVKSICTRRGAYTLGPSALRTGDPLGLFGVTLNYPACTNMMVVPPVIPLANIQVALGGRAGEGRRRTSSLERTVNAAGVRGYSMGDSLSWVHWKTSAHRDDLFVKLFESTPSSDWWIVVDLDRRVQVGEAENSTLEHAIVLAASLADRGLRSRRAVGLFAHGADLHWLVPNQGPAQKWEILRALAIATQGERSLSELLTIAMPSLKGAFSLIVITPAVTGTWIEKLLSLRWRGVVPTVLLLDPASFGGDQHSAATAGTLVDLEIAHCVIERDALDVPELRPGRGRLEWQISPRGRAVLRNKPRDAYWRRIG